MVAIRSAEAPDVVEVPAGARLRLVEPAGTGGRTPEAVYRRRRLAVGVAVALLAAVTLRLASPLLADPATVPPAAGGIHLVQPGDTYWSLAAELDTDGDVTATVDRLVALNGDRALQVGDRLLLPG